MTGDAYDRANEVLVAALDDLRERRERGDGLADLAVLLVTSTGDESDHVLNGLAVSVTQRLGTLRWFQMRAEHSLLEEWGDGG